MYIEFTPKTDFKAPHTFGEIEMKGDKKYIIHDSWIGSIPGSVSLLEDRFHDYTIDKDANGKSILFLRTLGGGDMLFLSALMKFIKDTYPDVKFGFACIKEQAELASSLYGIENVHPIPLDSEVFDKYDYHFEISGLIEDNEENKYKNVYDVLFEKLGAQTEDIGVKDEYKRPYINKDNIAPAKEKGLIGIHPFAHDPIRQWDPHVASKVADMLIKDGYKVAIFASITEYSVYRQIFHPSALWVVGSFSNTINVASKCEKIIGCDSLMVHLAQAVGTPTIALYGPFSSDTRVKYYKDITIVDSNPNCRCMLHGHGRCLKDFRVSPCMNFDPNFIMSLIVPEPEKFIKSTEVPVTYQIKSYNMTNEE